jgi:1,4-dihydroxy-2-naphthoate octaprenyltransferase
MNVSMWRKALQIIPHVTKEEWDRLDIISKWLISTRAAVFIMTFLSACIAGILAFQHGKFTFLNWLLVSIGLVFAHATNNRSTITSTIPRSDQEITTAASMARSRWVHGLLDKTPVCLPISWSQA